MCVATQEANTAFGISSLTFTVSLSYLTHAAGLLVFRGRNCSNKDLN